MNLIYISQVISYYCFYVYTSFEFYTKAHEYDRILYLSFSLLCLSNTFLYMYYCNQEIIPVWVRYGQWLLQSPLYMLQFLIFFHLDSFFHWVTLLYLQNLLLLFLWIGEITNFPKYLLLSFSFFPLYIIFCILQENIHSNIQFLLLHYFFFLYLFYGVTFLCNSYSKRNMLYTLLDVYVIIIPICFEIIDFIEK